MDDQEIELHRVAGDITLILEHGTKEEQSSLLRVITELSGQDRSDELRNQYCQSSGDEWKQNK